MLKEVNIDAIKSYNASIKMYKEKSTKLSAEIEFNEQELKNLCAELSRELGIEVTPENVEQIYNERVDSITETLRSGNEIIARIQREEAEQNAPQPAAVPQGSPVTPNLFGSAPTVGAGGQLFGDLPPMFT